MEEISSRYLRPKSTRGDVLRREKGFFNPAAWRSESLDCLSTGPLVAVCLCRSGVRTKPDVNMVTLKEF